MSEDSDPLSRANLESISASDFAKIWNAYDLDKSGFIEGCELDSVFYEIAKKLLHKEPTRKELDRIKMTFMSAYDVSADGKMSMNEMAKMLLSEGEMFLLLFRRKIPLDSSVTFMKIWRKYDKNNSGFISKDELKQFIWEYVTIAGETIEQAQLDEFASSIVELYDKNGDGFLDLQDMARLVNCSENFLLQFKIEDGTHKERKRDFKRIFKHYDQSESGALEGAEVDGFVKDMMETIRGPLSVDELEILKKAVLNHCDANKDGKIQKSELAVCLGIKL